MTPAPTHLPDRPPPDRHPSELPFVSVVVPVRNGADMIGDCISSILACDYPPDRHEVLVVDNASTDATAEVVRRHPVRLLTEPRRGVSFARNRGIAAGRGDVFAFIDGDCLADPAWIGELARPFQDPEVGCVAGELRHLPATTAAERQAVRMLGEWQRYAVSSNPPYAITANAAYRREVFESIGPFDTRMPRAQDVELGLRFNERSPFRLAYAEHAVARHRHRSTQRGFFRQQLGWSYGAGLVAAKYHALDGRPSPPPRLRDVATQVRGLAVTVRLLALRRGRREWVEDAWFSLIRQIAWYAGARAGMRRGARVFAGEARARTERGGPAYPEPPRA
jgi:glycosyltransferase involved in cell wall biosynthesis